MVSSNPAQGQLFFWWVWHLWIDFSNVSIHAIRGRFHYADAYNKLTFGFGHMLLIDFSVFYISTCELRLTDFTTCNVIANVTRLIVKNWKNNLSTLPCILELRCFICHYSVIWELSGNVICLSIAPMDVTHFTNLLITTEKCMWYC